MNFINYFNALFSRKESQARVAMSVQRLGQPVRTSANYTAMSKEGYQKNAIVFRCVQLISNACAGVGWELYSKKGNQKTEISEHELLKLLERPNPMMGQSQFIQNLVAYLCISGNSYIESAGHSENAPPMELWPVRPDFMTIVAGKLGYPSKYIFKAGDSEKVWDCEWLSGKLPLLHLKTFNPTDIWYGMSPMESALLNVDQMNSANQWNLSLLQNSASPSGILKVETNDANPTGSLGDEKFNRLKEQLEDKYAGKTKAGKMMLLEGGLSWQSIALSPKEMEWLDSKETTVKDICNVYGVPVMMLGYGDTTYKNYQEARLAFYEDTIIPILNFLKTEFNNWLVPKFGEGLELCFDEDDIIPLQEKKEAKYTSLSNAHWLTINEKREVTGFEEVEGWDVFNINGKLLASPEEIVEDDPTTPPSPPANEVEKNGKETDDGKSKSTSKKSSETKNSEEIIEEFKLFNPVNKDEKQGTWRKINVRRSRIQKPFAKMLEEDFKELARDIEKAAKSSKEPRLIEYALLKAIEDNTPQIEKTLKRYIRYTVEDFGSIVFDRAKSELNLIETKKNQKTWEQWADDYVARKTGKAITEIEGTTKKQVRKVVQKLVSEAIQEDSDIDVANELRETFDSLSKGRANNIAKTEINSASNSATTEAVRSLEIPNMIKEWVSLEDDRVRDGGDNGNGPNHAVMNGAQVGIDEKFSVPPDADMDGPGDPAADASQICNCRCTLIYKVGK